MTDIFRLGPSTLLIVSGIIVALSGIPLLYVAAGTIRNPNFSPVAELVVLLFVFQLVAVGLILVATGALFLAVPRWSLLWSLVGFGLSLNNLRTSFLGSQGLLVTASIMGVSAGLLGILSRLPATSRRVKTLTESGWLRAFPFALLATGVWGFVGIFFVCGPPDGIGTAACDVLGPGFYAVSTLVVAGILSTLASLVNYAHHRFTRVRRKKTDQQTPSLL